MLRDMRDIVRFNNLKKCMVMSNNNIDRRNFLKVLSTGTAAASTGLLYGCGGDPKRQGVSQTEIGRAHV